MFFIERVFLLRGRGRKYGIEGRRGRRGNGHKTTNYITICRVAISNT